MIKVEQLLSSAREQTGLSDLGDDAIFDGLNRLVDALNNEARLTPQGEQAFTRIIVGHLSNRMRVEDHLARHPELLERPVDKPMFVFGLPRTGTTLAINLLNADPARRCFLRWEAFNSVPPPTTAELDAGPRYQAEQERLEMSLKFAPHISAIHHEDADSPTECQFAMAPSFCAQVYDSQAHIPGYGDWFLHEADYLPAFRYHKRLLQLLQSDAPGHWTLKNPWHPLFLDALTTVYPDAQLVMTHRDPVEVVGSACSLLAAVRPMFSDTLDKGAIADRLMQTFDLMIERTIAFEATHGQGAIHHIQYASLMADPIAEVCKLYARFDKPFTPDAEAAMAAMLAVNPKGKHGGHTYALEDYGLTAVGIRAHFKDYCARYGIAQRD